MWARNYSKCIECRTTKFKHMAKGLCSSCYASRYRSDPEHSSAIRKQKQEWYQLNKDLNQMKKKRELLNFDGKRERVLERDNYTCQQCGSSDKLVVHHKDESGRGKRNHNNSLRNLVTLCKACHVNAHRKELLKARSEKLIGRWSRDYDACIECGTTDREHGSLGLCVNCYARHFWRKKHSRIKI